jgi:hypothetical protein
MTSLLPYDPLPLLLASPNQAIRYFAVRDLSGEDPGPIESLWRLPSAEKLLRKQQPDGRWRYPNAGRLRSPEDYDQIETYRFLGVLVEKYGFQRSHPSIQAAAGFLFTRQTAEGDFRGIYGTQYSPNYSAAIAELLVKAGYEDDPHIQHCFAWLLSMRQDDGGWAIPLRTRPLNPAGGQKASWTSVLGDPKAIQPDRSRPFSHLATGVVLRLFAAHPEYRRSEAALKAGHLLMERFFKPDKYIDRKAVSFWERVSFPFWFTDIVSALDSLTWSGFTAETPQIDFALRWLAAREQAHGGFAVGLLRDKDKDSAAWVDLAICRAFHRAGAI